MRNFKKNDSGFICAHCGAEVPPLGYTSRDHCNKCLHSLHVDIIPGDRENECKGTLVPVQTLPDAKKGFIIIYKRSKCGATVRNMMARDDDTELLIKLTAVKG
jgi:DNA-directed RNA polymerase subunit RPC12/RpoP